MNSPFRLTLLCSLLGLFGLGLYDFFANFEDNQCEMTYMYETPEYLKIDLSEPVRKKFPQYGLYFYGEGKYARDAERAKFRLTGIPVLFIPGNAGSHEQVRSLGSVALRMAKSSNFNFRFNFFALDFNGESSALFGPLLPKQTDFANECIRHILTLYSSKRSHKPESILLVGHSMGGVIARALFTLPGFNHKLVSTIITQAAPHQSPVAAFDPYMVNFYETVNRYWTENATRHLEDITIFSTSGGYRDILVRSGLASLDGIVNAEHSLWTSTMSVPRAWLSTDHRCHVWCKQIVLATVRAMFDSVNKTTKQIDVNPSFRKNAFQYHFEKNVGLAFHKASFDLMISLNKVVTWELRRRRSWKYIRDTVELEHYSVVQIGKKIAPQFGFLAVTNVDNVAWVGACTLKPKETRCSQIGNFARYSNLLPPAQSNLKVVHLDGDKLDMFTHWVAIVPKSTTKMIMMIDMYNVTKRHLVWNVTSLSDFFWSFPKKTMSEDVIIDATKPRNVYYRIDFRDLEIPLQAYVVSFISKGCTANSSAGAEYSVIKFSIPWSKENMYTIVPRGQNGQVSVRLTTAKPDEYKGYAQLNLYMMPSCTYQVVISIAWQELMGQFVRFYAGYLPAYFVIQMLMVLSWQLMMLDEQESAPSFSASHTRWAQPYRVVIASLGIRFILSYPEDDNLMTKLGLPVDDFVELSKQEIWYPALPILLYLVAYAFMAVYIYVIHALVAAIVAVISFCFKRFLSSPFTMKLLTICQYLVLGAGALGSAFICGSLGTIAAYVVMMTKMLGSYVAAKDGASSDEKVWSKFNVTLTLTLLLLAQLFLNMPSFVVWFHGLSWETLSLVNDPTMQNGLIVCVAVLLLVFADFPIMNNEMISVMGFIAYLCSVSMILVATVSIFRIPYFINAVLMTIALPSALISVSRARAERRRKTKQE